MRRSSTALAVMLLVLATVVTTASGVTDPPKKTAQKELTNISRVVPSGYGTNAPADVAVSTSPDVGGADGTALPGQPVWAWVESAPIGGITGGAIAAIVVAARGANTDATSTVATLASDEVGQVVFTSQHLVLLQGTPVAGRPGFVTNATLSVFSSADWAPSFSANLGPDTDVGRLAGDAQGDAVAFIVNSHALPQTDLAAYAPVTSAAEFALARSTIATSSDFRGLSLDSGTIALNDAGSLVVARASKEATSFSWGLSNSGTGGGVERVVLGSPSIRKGTLAWLESAGAAALGGVFVADLESHQITEVSHADAAVDVPGPVLTDDSVYWVRVAPDQTLIPVGGTAKTHVSPHILEHTNLRSAAPVTSDVGILGSQPGRLSVQVDGTRPTTGLFTEWWAGERRIHAIHRGEHYDFGDPAVERPSLYGTSVTLRISLPGTPTVPVSVESSRTYSVPRGKVSIQDFNRIVSVTPTQTVDLSVTIPNVTQRTLFQFVFPGDDDFGFETSRLMEFAPNPRVTIGVSPKTPAAKTPFRISGHVSNESAQIGAVKAGALTVERKGAKGYLSSVKSNPMYKPSATSGTNPLYQSGALRLRAGSYRARMVVPATDYHEGGSSAWIYFKVK